MNNSEEEIRLNKIRIIIDELGLKALTNYQKKCVDDYLELKNNGCEKEVDNLIMQVHQKRKKDYNNKK